LRKGLLVPGAAEQPEYDAPLSEFQNFGERIGLGEDFDWLARWGFSAIEGRLGYERLVEKASGPAV
jgi:hypothetical protein